MITVSMVAVTPSTVGGERRGVGKRVEMEEEEEGKEEEEKKGRKKRKGRAMLSLFSNPSSPSLSPLVPLPHFNGLGLNLSSSH